MAKVVKATTEFRKKNVILGVLIDYEMFCLRE